MSTLLRLRKRIVHVLEPTGDWFGLLPIRLLMAWEYGRAGWFKLNGSNWFANVQDNFPFPFNVVPVEISWFLATWFEILGAIGLVFGLFTRFWALSLIILTIVAIAGVHWPESYGSLGELWESYSVNRKTDAHGNFRIPLLFMAMLAPLVFMGAGKLSLDHALTRRLR